MPQSLDALRSQGASAAVLACRGCGAPAEEIVLDLGMLPLPDGTSAPLRVTACEDCRLVQLLDDLPPGCTPLPRLPDQPRRLDRDAEATIAWLGLHAGTLVAEIGSGDGSGLLPFARRGIGVLGIEWRQELAQLAAAHGVPTRIARFDAALARRLAAGGHAPVLISAPDALAEAPDLHDLLAGLRLLLAPGGVLVLELPYLLPVLECLRFDVFRHGRLCYHTLATAEVALAPHGLSVFDAESLPGGALRLFARHAEDRGKPVTEAVEALRQREECAGLADPAVLRGLHAEVAAAAAALRGFLHDARRDGLRVVGYGAPGQGGTLLAHCAIGPELLPFVAERDPVRHGGTMPGTAIPILPPAAIATARPDVVLVLAPDHADGIMRELAAIPGWHGCFALPGRRIDLFRGD
ncbi:MAG TPA: SAM-dependent methyltransferase [Falsiroseomonas sp.]|jgi:SAM-dependent methyltransferase|nr:SAM-dependent methyltransferase [Falsiroseomonas sp.]